ncbi:MAG: hypothetical protein PVG66_06115 [Chromatiales bacterium]|jgi:hypothetical protein
MKSLEIKRFAQTILLHRLGEGFQIHAKRDLVRLRGPFVQSVLLANKRSGWLHVIPTFYVIGADPAHEAMFQTMSLPISGVDDTGRWRMSPETPLNEALASHIMTQLEEESPLSYIAPLNDSNIHKTLNLFYKKVPNWMPGLSLAFWEILAGKTMAARSLAKAKRKFIRYSRYGTNKFPRDFEQELMKRFDVLESRLGTPEGLHACRQEAEAHAERLGLGKIGWP